MGLNKGEWSELYAIFYLLINKNLKIVDCKLRVIANDIFCVDSIISKKKKGIIKFKIIDDIVIPTIFGEEIDHIGIDEIKKFKDNIFSNIMAGGNGSGSFRIPSINEWLNEHNIETNFKAGTGTKEDIFLLNLDINRNQKVELGYSIKSQLGSPATILNASSHTNFKYKVIGLTNDQIKEINLINTKNKLIDRIATIKKYGGKIVFDKVVSETFNSNLKMIDTSLPAALSEILLNSYQKGIKDLQILFKQSTIYTDQELAIKKLKDFLMAVSFGMFPGEKWNGEFTANGGLIIVAMNSEVYILDMIYFQNEVKKYLINETKLDSPSSTRHNMLYLEIENGEIYFTLNLQIRYKK